MKTLVQALTDSHRDVYMGLEVIRRMADLPEDVSEPELRAALDEVLDFLRQEVLPGCRAEQTSIYPLIGTALQASDAVLRQEDDVVVRLMEKLEALRQRLVYAYFGPQQRRDVRAVLYQLYTVIGMHFIKEDEIYVPMLDSLLTGEQRNELEAAFERSLSAEVGAVA